ncbi:Dabb family protein [Variovorax ginsengisoli]|uniref:Stress-response A/B barrel domain-containing protein n=1 Tax=Variovorax ginsengisoli TaxID=363844 RepID=A0ABT9SA98_9BURK|nr:Dabb family protein [Variovorax ginsengisoli]MDP9901130.1 hypothetical protein [Variovorax ginsengisoli]
MIRHIVMWDIAGNTPEDKRVNIDLVRRSFEGLSGLIPGLRHLEVGVDSSAVDYACDVVLFSDFESRAALDAYAHHPEHLRVRDALAGIRIRRHQVDYEVAERVQA